MRYLRIALLSTLVAVLAGASAPVTADPLPITGGSLDIAGQPTSAGHVGFVDISGDRGFTLFAVVDGAFGIYLPGTTCNSVGCEPGRTIDLRASWTGGDLRDTRATLDGVTYTDIGGTGSTSSASVDFTGTATLPDALAPSAVISAPFNFTGLFAHDSSREDLFGRGTATIFLESIAIPNLAPGWGVSRIRYQLSSMPGEPIPEPATLLLLGAGLGGGLLARRAGHKRRTDAF